MSAHTLDLELDPAESEDCEDPQAVMLTHAVRVWEAEVENARRVAAKRNGLLTLGAAALGFGLFRIGSLEELDGQLDPDVLLWLRGLLFASLIPLMIAMWHGMRRPPHSEKDADPIFASELLCWPLDGPPLGELDPSAARWVSRERFEKATDHLRIRNERSLCHIGEVQVRMGLAATLAALAMAVYLVGARIQPKEGAGAASGPAREGTPPATKE